MRFNFAMPIFISLVIFGCQSKEKECDETVVDTDSSLLATAFQPVSFSSGDGLQITANLYETTVEAARPIVLCHQARFNKFEYAGVAEELNKLGFHCLAIDQRSGGPIGNMPNGTNLAAQEKGLGTDYLDAIGDIHAAVEYMSGKYNQPVILWGSSYSSTLVLYEATKNENVSAVVSFSPGDYFADSLGSLVPLLAVCPKPMFLTSGSWEVEGVSQLIAGKALSANQVQFVPKGDGYHGSMALWPGQEGGEEYWEAITSWLGQLQ